MDASERLSRERATWRLFHRLALATLCMIGGLIGWGLAVRYELGLGATYAAIVAGVFVAWLELTRAPLRRLLRWEADVVEARLSFVEQLIFWIVTALATHVWIALH